MSIWESESKSGTIGQGWAYNEPNFTYDIDQDTFSGLGSVLYNYIGLAQIWTALTKH